MSPETDSEREFIAELKRQFPGTKQIKFTAKCQDCGGESREGHALCFKCWRIRCNGTA